MANRDRHDQWSPKQVDELPLDKMNRPVEPNQPVIGDAMWMVGTNGERFTLVCYGDGEYGKAPFSLD